MAEHDHTPTARAPLTDQSATREDFDRAFSQARIITDIIAELANGAVGGSATTSDSLYSWLAEELEVRLERIEVADQTMRRARA